jgi:hypothetical protein
VVEIDSLSPAGSDGIASLCYSLHCD